MVLLVAMTDTRRKPLPWAHQPTDRQTDGQEGSKGSYTFNNDTHDNRNTFIFHVLRIEEADKEDELMLSSLIRPTKILIIIV